MHMYMHVGAQIFHWAEEETGDRGSPGAAPGEAQPIVTGSYPAIHLLSMLASSLWVMGLTACTHMLFLKVGGSSPATQHFLLTKSLLRVAGHFLLVLHQESRKCWVRLPECDSLRGGGAHIDIIMMGSSPTYSVLINYP